MSVDDAVLRFEDAGLIVHRSPSDRSFIGTAADPSEPAEVYREQGVTTVFGFGFTLKMIDRTWFLRTGPPTPAEQFDDLHAAVERGLALFRAYRAEHPP